MMIVRINLCAASELSAAIGCGRSSVKACAKTNRSPRRLLDGIHSGDHIKAPAPAPTGEPPNSLARATFVFSFQALGFSDEAKIEAEQEEYEMDDGAAKVDLRCFHSKSPGRAD